MHIDLYKTEIMLEGHDTEELERLASPGRE
jgi:hypothetical protein